MSKNISIFLFINLALSFGFRKGQAQTSLSLQECYSLARENYPLVRQQELIKRSAEYNIKNAGKGYLPQIAINGQASYQSAVTALPISLPGIRVPELSKDQYRIYGEINQALFDGDLINQQKKAQEANALLEINKMEVELFKLKERINQLFFGLLLCAEQIKQLKLVQKDLEENIKKMDAAVSNGVALKSNADVLQAELLKNGQRLIEIQTSSKAYLAVLSLFINKPIDENTSFIKPDLPKPSSDIRRPELNLIEQQSRSLEIQRGILKAKNLPRLGLFLQAGYGRPALNMLSNKFETYYIGGLRLNWSLNGLYTIHNDKALLDISRKNLDIQKDVFLVNSAFNLKQSTIESQKFGELLRSDDNIISLRSRIKAAASAQLQNGLITPSDYLRELNAEEQARENKYVHEIQFLMNLYNQQLITGD